MLTYSYMPDKNYDVLIQAVTPGKNNNPTCPHVWEYPRLLWAPFGSRCPNQDSVLRSQTELLIVLAGH